ncbi:beta-lactamase/transpeptidase-like protein [Ophiobolus disseminans]|uniref:Beta-lactamase/transpeptidase-like protein n=1 Tax=Ophiobolus disseminans TaxID=1469910 RepID=A0A6A6ZYP5_9PLEO|nr:beta-lactamase/transpeptidase-like protein [Ophiobolus disseminans]
MDTTTNHRLEALAPEITQTLQSSGSPSLSFGILHNGTIIHTAHFGHRNAGDSVPTNDSTINYIASLNKLFTTAIVAKLVHDGILHWDVPIREYLPAFRTRKDELCSKATLRHSLSIRTGFAPANSF